MIKFLTNWLRRPKTPKEWLEQSAAKVLEDFAAHLRGEPWKEPLRKIMARLEKDIGYEFNCHRNDCYARPVLPNLFRVLNLDGNPPLGDRELILFGDPFEIAKAEELHLVMNSRAFEMVNGFKAVLVSDKEIADFQEFEPTVINHERIC